MVQEKARKHFVTVTAVSPHFHPGLSSVDSYTKVVRWTPQTWSLSLSGRYRTKQLISQEISPLGPTFLVLQHTLGGRVMCLKSSITGGWPSQAFGLHVFILETFLLCCTPLLVTMDNYGHWLPAQAPNFIFCHKSVSPFINGTKSYTGGDVTKFSIRVGIDFCLGFINVLFTFMKI